MPDSHSSQSSPQRILLSWSSGKDSAWALHVLRADPRFEVVGLLTSVNERHERVAMHGVRDSLLRAQAEAVGLPLHVVDLPSPCSNDEYEARFIAATKLAADQGVEGLAFGDLFLADVRAYRERLMEATGLAAHFPLWGRETSALAAEMLAGGTKAVLTCVDPRACPRSFAGREYDQSLLDDLPVGVDPCGENGEFHTFTYAGPAFGRELCVERGEVVERGGFVFADVLATPEPA